MESLPVYLEEIEKRFLDTMYQRGYNYFLQGRVKTLHYEGYNNKWYGKVVGSKIYHVIVSITEDDIDFDCECFAFREFDECKHVVACLLEIESRQPNNSPEMNVVKQEREQQTINYFVNAFSSFQQTQAYSKEIVTKQPLLVEFIVKTQSQFTRSNLWSIELKVGVKRTYVVKNINQFLTAVEADENYFFTERFTYDPTEHVFTRDDFDVIQLLLKIKKNELAYASNFYRKDDRSLTIPPMVVDEFLAKLKQTNFSFDSTYGSYKQIEIIDNEIPFSFKLDKGSNDNFSLDITTLMQTQLFDAYNYAWTNNALYKLTGEQQTILREISSGLKQPGRRFVEQESIPIAKEQMESFLSIVIPEMKKVGQLEITEQVSDQISQYPLKAKMLVDLDEETLLVDVEYNYGPITINPFQQYSVSEVADTNELIIRDVQKEQAIMTAIETALLKYNGKKLYVEGEEDMYNFLFHTLPYLEDKADIFLTNAVKTLLLPESHAPETSFDFNSDGSLLEVSFDMKDVDKNHLQDILQTVIEKKKYYRLPNGTFVSIEGNDQFRNISKLYADLNVSSSEFEDGKLQLPVYRALQVDEIINEGSRNKIRVGKQFRRLINDLKNPDQLDFDKPVNLQAELRDYQEIGFQWLKTLAHYSLGGILADDMGLGKTLQAITFLLSEKQQSEEAKPALIVSPASLVYNWKMEFEKFAPDLQVEVVIGSPIERQAMLESQVMPDVWITSYPTLRQDIDWYADRKFSSFFLDEAQAIKNAATKTSKAVRSINAHKRFALSGTPIENSLDELWAIFQVILPGFFPQQAVFRKLEEEKISKMVRPFILRRLKKDVLTELPDKIETTHVSELTTEQKGLYIAYLERIQKETKETLQTEGLNKSRIKILAGLTRLRQLCCHPSLFIENYEGSSGKLEQLIEIVSNAQDNKKRMLIFSQFTSMLHIIREQLTSMGIPFFYIDGQTPSKQRVEMVERFNQGENDIFLISLKAGGTGLNLTGADTVILYDLWWNPAVEEQAAGRAHRMGQKNVVQVIRLLTKGTIEEKIYQLQQRKKELIEKVIQPGEAMLSSITEDEIRELLSIN
ncbi:DEAD/DEAH box helicase [Aquibacillus rhizosphaerae]|uniref:DEAD/DEAH box helicase n=1 Tax=Aquibacillus rhizosphaerae TaxID=3051431 RepID=A0ABT7LCK7_9BACI|nr:DEAD/DEAH box helicase [Aquibacillus sp. LR5S19]MDL4843169.1 DEAD/DEAH box helicase [Aquibacillus sp. LR5S19]